MLRLLKISLLGALASLAIQQAIAFSLGGPFANDGNTLWQTPQVGYGPPYLADIGGVMNLGQEYRWNVSTIYYAMDSTFLTYFGARGVQEIDKAAKFINDLPPMSTVNIDNYPLKSERINFRAQALGLLDLKSTALSVLVEELGLAPPSRFVFTLRARDPAFPPGTNYFVVKRNFDPITLAPSSYINGDLWTYTSILEPPFVPDGTAATLNQRVDPLAYGNPVADRFSPWTSFSVGTFYTGLTRDDVGGLRYIYRQQNQNVENAITNAFGGSSFGGSPATGGGIAPWLPIFPASTNGAGGSVPLPSTGTGLPPWLPVFPAGGTNAAGAPGAPGGVTNAFINTALRGGVDKINLVKVEYDSLLGQFTAFADSFTDLFVTNNNTFSQNLQRIVQNPDILFGADDLSGPPDAGFVPTTLLRSANWANNSTLNGLGNVTAGPGTIDPTVTIILNKMGPFFFNAFFPFNLSEEAAIPGFVWGSFDGTTNAPIVYPSGVSIEDLERQVLGGP